MKTLIFWAALLCSNMVFAAEFGIVDELEGAAYLTNTEGQQMSIKLGQAIHTGQTIHTAINSELHITSSDGGLIALRPESIFQVDEYIANHSPQDKVVLRLIKGGMRSITGWIPKHHPESYQVSTLVATIGVRGTDHEVHIIEAGKEESGVHNRVHVGATILRNALGEVHIKAGEFAHAPHDVRHAPRLLAQKPKFHDNLILRIEHKLEQRKNEMMHLLDGMRDAWLKRFGQNAS